MFLFCDITVHRAEGALPVLLAKVRSEMTSGFVPEGACRPETQRFAHGGCLAFWLAVLLAVCSGGVSPRAASAESPEIELSPRPPRGYVVEITPLERALFTDASDGTLNDHSLADAALIASGVSDVEELEVHRRQLEQFLQDYLDGAAQKHEGAAHEAAAQTQQASQQAADLFRFMHEKMLQGGYRLDCTDLTELLKTGRYNCVSSAVLFTWMAKEADLDVRGVEVPGHAFCVLRSGQDSQDVETTCARWFDTHGNPKQQQSLVEAHTGFKGNRHGKDRREVSNVALVGIIYYNRGVTAIGRKQFPEAVAANFKSLWLDPHGSTAAQNLRASFNNWALAESAEDRYEDAMRVLRQGLEIAPLDATLVNNRVAIYQQWSDHYRQQRQWDRALDVLDRAVAELPTEARLDQARFQLYREEGARLLAENQKQAAFELFAAGQRRYVNHPAMDQAIASAVSREALACCQRHDYEASLAMFQKARILVAEEPMLEQNRRAVLARWADEALNRGDYREALRRVTSADRPQAIAESLRNYVDVVYQRWTQDHLQQGNLDEAIDVALAADANPFLAQGGDVEQHGRENSRLSNTLEGVLAESIREGQLGSVAEVLGRISQIDAVTRRGQLWEQLRETAFTAYHNAAVPAVHQGDPTISAEVLDALLADRVLGSQPKLRAAALEWHVSAYHNSALMKANSGQYRQAVDTLNAAMEDARLRKSPEALRAIQQRRADCYLLWSNQHLQRHEWQAGAVVLREGMKCDPDAAQLRDQWRYCLEHWLDELFAREDLARAREVLLQAESHDGEHPRWQQWHKRLGA